MFRWLKSIRDGRKARRMQAVSDSISPLLMQCAQGMHLRVFGLTLKSESPATWKRYPYAYGVYLPSTDSVGLNVGNLTDSLLSANEVLAHEVIHATGHPWRRARMTPDSFFEASGGSNDAAIAREEVIAQYGAMILLRRLGLCTQAVEHNTERYLQRFKRPDGLPSHSEAVEAIRAVKFVIRALEILNGGQNHAARSSDADAA